MSVFVSVTSSSSPPPLPHNHVSVHGGGSGQAAAGDAGVDSILTSSARQKIHMQRRMSQLFTVHTSAICIDRGAVTWMSDS